MIPLQSVSDEDKYVPAGLQNSADNTLEKNAMNISERWVFPNLNKSPESEVDHSKESKVIVDLSKEIKTEILDPTPPALSKSSPTPRVLTLQPGSHLPILPTDAPRPIPPPPKTYIPRAIRVQPNMYHPVPFPMSVPPVIPFNRPMIHPPRAIPYPLPAQMPMKVPPPIIAPQQPMMNMYGYPCMPPIQPPMNPMNPMNPIYHPGMMMIPHGVPFMNPASTAPLIQAPSVRPQEPMMLPPEPKLKISPETRKRLKEEAAAKLKAERDARKALLKAQKLIEKAKKAVIKKKKDTAMVDSGLRKFGSFSKDMFVIRLKDVDSFSRNNEIWRIDNHVLIQKFCGVPSLRAPARQFQSTNRMSGYDHRATWRLFIINPENVEIEKHGSEVTIHNFPTISVLRESKQLAEIKDVAFKEIERTEYKEKMHDLEAKKRSKIQARLKKRLERKQKKLMKAMELKKFASKRTSDIPDDSALDEDYHFHLEDLMTSDERVCRDVLNGLLNALDDEQYEMGGLYSDDGSYMSDEEDEEDDCEDTEEDDEEEEDAGSLISMANFSYDFEDGFLDEKPPNFPVFTEDEVPAVELEIVID